MPSHSTDSLALRIARPLLYPVRLLLRRKGDEQATINRLFSSQHVRDIQVIVANAVLIFVPILLLVSWCRWTQFWRPARPVGRTISGSPVWENSSPFRTGARRIRRGAHMAYQVGSARLGVVDLFACEITTLCRVAFVSDTVDRLIDRFNQGPPRAPAGASGMPAIRQFTSQETIFRCLKPTRATCRLWKRGS